MEYLWFVLELALVLAILIFVRMSGIVRYVPNADSAVIERLWSSKGSLKQGVIALDGEAGFLPDVLRGGIHFFKPFSYRVRRQPIPTVAANEIGYVVARSGAPLPVSQVLGRNDVASDFFDVRHFLTNGGQKGPQRQILRGGVHPINLAQFVVITKEKIYSLDLDDDEEKMIKATQKLLSELNGFDPVMIDSVTDQIGLVTVLEGPALPPGELVAPIVGDDANDQEKYHHAFQDPEAFLRARGYKGRQEQVLVEGSYYINRLFATVDLAPKTVIEVGYVGVVVSNIGKDHETTNTSGDNKHGDLVEKGYKGVMAESLAPGKYAFNQFCGRVEPIQTTNIILRFDAGQVSEHRLDANLKEIGLITKDAFEPDLPLSVVLHIPVQHASKVVQRFGNLPRLVNETIDPLVSSWFKNLAQTRDVKELIQERVAIQEEAKSKMKAQFGEFNIELVDVLMGTPRGQGIEKILEQLRDRQIASEQVETFKAQKSAADEQRILNDSQAQAASQGDITRSKISIQVAQNEGEAKLASAAQEAKTIQVLAEANSKAAKIQGEGEGERLAKIGEGQARGISAKVQASGGAQYQMVTSVMERVASAIETSKQAVVPHTLVTSGQEGAGGNALVQMFQALMSVKMDAETPKESAVPAAAAAVPTDQRDTADAPA